MIEFLYHDGIQKEIGALERRFRTIRDGLKTFERLCEVQFNPRRGNEPTCLVASVRFFLKLPQITPHSLKANGNH